MLQPLAIYEEADKICRAANCEAEYRTAASRAYYAAFHHVMKHPRLADFKPSHSGDDHRDLIEHLKRSKDGQLYRLGVNFLARLRAIRNHADYDLDITFTKGMADEALERATEIIFEFLPK